MTWHKHVWQYFFSHLGWIVGFFSSKLSVGPLTAHLDEFLSLRADFDSVTTVVEIKGFSGNGGGTFSIKRIQTIAQNLGCS